MNRLPFILVNSWSSRFVSIQSSIYDISQSKISPKVLSGYKIVSRSSVSFDHFMAKDSVISPVSCSENAETVLMIIFYRSTF